MTIGEIGSPTSTLLLFTTFVQAIIGTSQFCIFELRLASDGRPTQARPGSLKIGSKRVAQSESILNGERTHRTWIVCLQWVSKVDLRGGVPFVGRQTANQNGKKQKDQVHPWEFVMLHAFHQEKDVPDPFEIGRCASRSACT